MAVTDARACYASIEADVVLGRLLHLGVPPDAAAEIGSWLRAFRDHGVEGLPVGPASSALLADAVLSVGDDAIRPTGVPHVRWVDDVVLFARDGRAGLRALDALRRSWRGIGLEVHEGKTAILTGPDAAAALTAGVTSHPCSVALR
jgi:hypothetical protein